MIWTEPSPSDFDRWEAAIRGGATPHDAAVELRFRGSSAFRRADRVRHAGALDEWRRVRDADKTKEAA